MNPAALYAAQATEVMLDAIAHSNGTRQSVTRALLASCVQNGILGSFCFDANGDPTVPPSRSSKPTGQENARAGHQRHPSDQDDQHRASFDR